MRVHSRSFVALASLVFTCLFFIEYLPGLKRVHIPYDLDGFHYPLLNQAFQSLRQGRFPEWDPIMYCGTSFVGNVQATLFYPPNWVLFAANLGRQRLSYQSVEILVIAHVWLAFFLCYLWLRARRLASLPSVLGAGIFAYGGYLLLQLQHFGLACGYAWMPLALWGIDQSAEARDWRPLWKVVVASALCFLAGYTPTWVAFAVCATVYAAARSHPWKMASWTVLALVASLLLSMVQLFPAWEATAMKVHEPKYGSGIRNPEYYATYLAPNYFDFALERAPGPGGQDYLYLGVPAFCGLTCAIWRRKLGGCLAPLAALAVSLVAVTNLFDIPGKLVGYNRLLMEVCRDWYFLAGVTLALAPIAAAGLEGFLQQTPGSFPRWLTPMTIGALVLWSLSQIWIWLPGGPDFASGWRSAVYPAVLLPMFALGMHLLRGEQGRRRAWLAGVSLLAVGVDYKVFGTSKRFNAAPGNLEREFFTSPYPGLDDAVAAQLFANPEYRVALDGMSPIPTELRHFGLATPQGFDPMLPSQYSERMKAFVRADDIRQFDLPLSPELLRRLGVRYFLTNDIGPLRQALQAHPDFRLLKPSETWGKVFELQDPQPSYRFETPDQSAIQRTLWEPGRRHFLVRSAAGGRFILVEQFFPGWRAIVDGSSVTIERYDGAFQAIPVPPGEHRIQFEFRSRGLRIGAAISVLALLALVLVVKKL